MLNLYIAVFSIEQTPLSGWSINALMWLLTPPKVVPTPTSSEGSGGRALQFCFIPLEFQPTLSLHQDKPVCSREASLAQWSPMPLV